MDKTTQTLLLLKDFIRKNPKTTWGKNELVKELDDLEERIIEIVNYKEDEA